MPERGNEVLLPCLSKADRLRVVCLDNSALLPSRAELLGVSRIAYQREVTILRLAPFSSFCSCSIGECLLTVPSQGTQITDPDPAGVGSGMCNATFPCVWH